MHKGGNVYMCKGVDCLKGRHAVRSPTFNLVLLNLWCHPSLRIEFHHIDYTVKVIHYNDSISGWRAKGKNM